jgi:hypothetical protein
LNFYLCNLCNLRISMHLHFPGGIDESFHV